MRKSTSSILALAGAGIVIGASLIVGHSRCADLLARRFDTPAPIANAASPLSFSDAVSTGSASLRSVRDVNFTAPAPARGSAAAHRFIVQADGSLLETNRGRVIQVISPQSLDRLSAPGQRILAFWDKPSSHWSIVFCREDGALLHRIVLTSSEVDAATAIMSMRLLPSGLLFLDMHINPQLGVGVVIEPQTRQWRAIPGCCFTWNAAGTHLAYDVEPPGGNAQRPEPASIYLDGLFIRHVAPGSIRKIVWNDESNFLIEAETTSGQPRTFKARCDLTAKQPLSISAAVR